MTEDKPRDPSRKTILARRAKFLAAALVAAFPGEGCSKETDSIARDPAKVSDPVDASVASPDAEGPEAEPTPCLSVAPTPPPDAPTPKPVACLKVAPHQD